MNHYLRLLRPSQWIKNTFVFAPLVFSKHLFDPLLLFAALKGFISFCIISSAVYVINDIFDKEADAAHPLKRNRPIASEAVSIPAATLLSAALIGIASFVCFSLPLAFQLVLGSYLVLQLLYSMALKKIVILNVFIIASGFMLRVLAGAEVIDVVISHWIILCTMFLSLFLALAKRRGEIAVFHLTESRSERKVLQEYDVNFLDGTMMITSSGNGNFVCALHRCGTHRDSIWNRLPYFHNYFRPLRNFSLPVPRYEKKYGRKFCCYYF